MRFVRNFTRDLIQSDLEERIDTSFQALFNGEHEILHREPDERRPGLVLYADGVDWNPGSGEGLYRRSLASTWVFIG